MLYIKNDCIFKDDKEFSEFYNQLQDRLNEKEKRKN